MHHRIELMLRTYAITPDVKGQSLAVLAVDPLQRFILTVSVSRMSPSKSKTKPFIKQSQPPSLCSPEANHFLPQGNGHELEVHWKKRVRYMFSDALRLVEEFIAQRNASGAVALMGTADKMWGAYPFGHLSFFPNTDPVRADSIFDLASLTKVISTTTIALKLLEAGEISLDNTIGDFVPWAPEDKRPLSIRQLLSHTSGIPAVAPLYESPRFESGEGALAAALDLLLSNPTGTTVEYSASALLCYRIMEQLTGSSLAGAVSQHSRETAAAAGHNLWGRGRQAVTHCLYRMGSRGEALSQESVHDENAWELQASVAMRDYSPVPGDRQVLSNAPESWCLAGQAHSSS